MAKKYYWLKLQNDFFKRHDIRIIEDMPNGKDYILFYMKLLVESISHEGNLRFSETIPYNESMLSTITNTNIDIVRTAIKVFGELGLMGILDDGTLFMEETNNMIGEETDWAKKKRAYREKEGQKKTLSDKSKSLELEKELDIEKDKEVISKPKRASRFTPPSLDEVKAYCLERKNSVDAKKFYDYYTASDWHRADGKKVKNWKQSVVSWEGRDYGNKKVDQYNMNTGNEIEGFI